MIGNIYSSPTVKVMSLAGTLVVAQPRWASLPYLNIVSMNTINIKFTHPCALFAKYTFGEQGRTVVR